MLCRTTRAGLRRRLVALDIQGSAPNVDALVTRLKRTPKPDVAALLLNAIAKVAPADFGKVELGLIDVLNGRDWKAWCEAGVELELLHALQHVGGDATVQALHTYGASAKNTDPKSSFKQQTQAVFKGIMAKANQQVAGGLTLADADRIGGLTVAATCSGQLSAANAPTSRDAHTEK